MTVLKSIIPKLFTEICAASHQNYRTIFFVSPSNTLLLVDTV